MSLKKVQIGNCELYHCDCLEVLSTLKDDSIDCIITDPPYDMHVNATRWNNGAIQKVFNNIKNKKLNSFRPQIYFEKIKTLNIKSFFIFCNNSLIKTYLEIFTDYNYDVLIWAKTNPVPFINNKWLSDIEYLLYFYKTGNRIFNNKLDSSNYRKVFVSKCSEGREQSDYYHPTIKPIELIKNKVLVSSAENGIVIDMFMGSGTAGVVCANTNRRFIGVEIDKEYFDIACKRIKDAYRNKQHLLFN